MNNIFWQITILLYILLLVPWCVQKGMFVDGLTYGAIARNISIGIGDICSPQYTQTLYPVFREHPPLQYILQSLFFMCFGDVFFVERLYGIIICVLTIICVIRLWKLCMKGISASYSWLPVLLWITVPLTSWSYQNNILETTMLLFDILAIYYLCKYCINTKYKIYITLGSLSIVCAFLTKGFVGLFPIITPICFYASFEKHYTKGMLCSVIVGIISCVILSTFLIVFPELKIYLIEYIDQQVLSSLNNDREITTDNRFSLLATLLLELTIPLLFVCITFYIYGRIHNTISSRNMKTAIFFLSIAISGSIPLVLSLKQRLFYTFPSTIFFVLSASAISIKSLESIRYQIGYSLQKKLNYLFYFGLFCCIIFCIFRYNTYLRDETKQNDIYTIATYLENGKLLGVLEKDLCQDWGLVAYLSRIGNFSIIHSSEKPFLLVTKTYLKHSTIPKGYESVPLNLEQFVILKKL